MREASEADRPVLRHQLRQKMGEVVKLGLRERATRIARLEKALAEEKEKLAADEENVTQRVDDRMRTVLRAMQQQSANRPERRPGDGPQKPATDAVGSQAR
jgi:hypothetical protein